MPLSFTSAGAAVVSSFVQLIQLSQGLWKPGVDQIASVYFRADQESSPTKGNPKMDHLATKSHPTSKHRDCSLSSPTLPSATRLREGQQLLQGPEEFPFLLRGCGKTALGQKDPVCLGVIQNLQLIIIEL